MTYRAKPVTQRDGSKLANSNCRMASIATGIDYQTLGKDTSTGARMRSYTDDQEGGTDSGDARQSWSRGYDEAIRVKDGSLWTDAVADLKAGRLVHLDIWAAATGSAGMCLSGSGGYGHTIAVAPEASGSRWLVADPWCNPAKWQWVEAAKLRAGAEEWGRRAGAKANVTSGRRWTAEELIRVVAAAKALMSLFRPDNPDPTIAVTVNDVNVLGGVETSGPETGGSQPILYTTTKAQGGGPTPGGDDVRFVNVGGTDEASGMLINVGETTRWQYLDGADGGDIPGSGAVTWIGKADSQTGQHVIRIKVPQPYSDKVARDTHVLLTSTNEPYRAPTPPTPEPPDNGSYDEGFAAGWNGANQALKGEVDQLIPPMETGGPGMDDETKRDPKAERQDKDQGLVEEEDAGDAEEAADEETPEVVSPDPTAPAEGADGEGAGS